MTKRQTFKTPDADAWMPIDVLPGVAVMPLAQPVKDGSIHRARLAKGTVIPLGDAGRDASRTAHRGDRRRALYGPARADGAVR